MTNNMLSMLQQLKSNPLQFLLQRRMNIPQNMPMNDPNSIMNYLLQSGQVSLVAPGQPPVIQRQQ